VVKPVAVKIDPLLEPLLLIQDSEQADSFLTQLITTHLDSIIQGVIHHKLHLYSNANSQQHEADDIRQEVVLQLLAELQKFRSHPETHSIRDVRGLTAVITYRTCSRWMRRQFPERHALKNRLYYLMTRQRGFALWPAQNGKLVAGFASWRGQNSSATKPLRELISADEKLQTRVRSTGIEGKQAGWSEVLAAIFEQAGTPIDFDDLVSALSSLLYIRNQPLESTDESETRTAVTTDTAWQIEKRIFLQRLWEEVAQLPLNQRAALLLNLKDAEGRGCIGLFPAAGIATVRELAETIGMEAVEFAELWNRLPLDDMTIAQRLGLARQQVINARKSARERLARRLKGFI
jgi:DNA-directed RNA polymerase specialized sigma24 family protein